MITKIVLILVVVFGIVWVISKATGDNAEEALGNAIGASIGCGSIILQVIIFGAIIAFGLWLFS